MAGYVLLVVAGFVAGYLNAIAGAGSLLTLPALVFSGLDASAANATNRIAIMFQNIATMEAYRRGKSVAGRLALWVCIPAAIGSALGAYIATLLDADELGVAIAVAMVVMLVLSFVRARPKADAAPPPTKLTPLLFAGFLGIGVYGGFIQAGAGVLVLLFLSLVYGFDLVSANALKVVAILVLSLVALLTFAVRRETIDLPRGLVLAVSTSAGGWFGAHAALKRGEAFIRIVLVVTVVASAAKLLYDAL